MVTVTSSNLCIGLLETVTSSYFCIGDLMLRSCTLALHTGSVHWTATNPLWGTSNNISRGAVAISTILVVPETHPSERQGDLRDSVCVLVYLDTEYVRTYTHTHSQVCTGRTVKVSD